MRLSFRWLVGASAVAIAPKCVLCVLGYVGVGAATLGGPEICGATDSDSALITAVWLGVIAGSLLLLAIGVRRARR